MYTVHPTAYALSFFTSHLYVEHHTEKQLVPLLSLWYDLALDGFESDL